MANITTRINNWIIFYTVLLITWIAIVVMALESLLPNNANFVTRIVEICSNSVSDLNIIGVFFMWFLMSIAMMSPTIIPTLKTYEDILESGGKRENSFWWFITGFLSIWMIFSILMSLTQVFLGRLYLLNDQGAFVSSLISSGFLVLAGLYQLSSYKEACLIKCWALMALAFVGGVMNLAFMAIMTFFMMLEKIPDYGKYISKPLSLILIGSGTVLVWF